MGNVRLVGEDEGSEDQTRLILRQIGVEPDRTEEPAPPRSKPPTRESLIEVMGVLARILGFRIQLTLGFAGAVGIGAYAVYQANAMALVAAGMYNLMVFAPLAFIAHKRG